MARIPRSSPSWREKTFCQLILRLPVRPGIHFFEGGIYFRCGSSVEESALHPTPEYSETPLLLEYAGRDHTGRGHNRSNDIHVLWQWNAAESEWRELARVLSRGPEWFHHLAPIVRRELHAQPVALSSGIRSGLTG